MTDYPDGIAREHMPAQQRWGRVLAWAVLVLLGVVLAVAMTGFFGGRPGTARVVQEPAAALEFTAPEVLRNGEFFEMLVRVEAKRPIAKPVIAISNTYWRHVTINTMIPAPSEEGFDDGAFEFTYGAMEAGDTLELKIDGQVNPARQGASKGTVQVLDDKTPLASLPVRLKVFP